MAPGPLIVRDVRFREHAMAGGHPERPERLVAVDAALEGVGVPTAARPATDDEILRVHDADHLARLSALEGEHARLDPDTYFAPRSCEIARLAAGGLIDAALAVARSDAPSAFAALRPPGHHAERGHAMGFCLLNSVAIAAEALRSEAGLERIAVLDWDVHHGNGTQHHFEDDRDVFFVSTHQFPFYPGTGAANERGIGNGLGATLNIPLPAGCGDGEYAAALNEIALPALADFRPDLVLVSAGFDAHADDPLAGMAVSTAGFFSIAAAVRGFADAYCGGRLVLALEGGYDCAALAASVRATVDVLDAEGAPDAEFPAARPGGIEHIAALRSAHAEFWPTLG